MGLHRITGTMSRKEFGEMGPRQLQIRLSDVAQLNNSMTPPTQRGGAAVSLRTTPITVIGEQNDNNS